MHATPMSRPMSRGWTPDSRRSGSSARTDLARTRNMPSLSRTYYESQSVEEVFLRRQMQHIAVALDKHPADVQREAEERARALERQRQRPPTPGSVSIHTLRAIGGPGGGGGGGLGEGFAAHARRPGSIVSRAPTAPAHASVYASLGATAPSEWSPHGPAPLPPRTAPPAMRATALLGGGHEAIGAGGADGGGADEHTPRSARDAQTIAELRAETESLRARLSAVEGMMRHVNVEYTLQLQARLQDSFTSIDERLVALDSTLLTERQKQQVRAATALSAGARGFVSRARYRRARDALGAWRRRQLASTSDMLLAYVLRQRIIEAQLHVIETSAARALLNAVVRGWRNYTLGILPARGELAQTIAARRHYRQRLQAALFAGWRRVVRAARVAGMTFVVRANKRVALREHDVRTMRDHMRAWQRLTASRVETERRFTAVLRRLEATILRALRSWVEHARTLRLVALERWIDLIKRRSELPFRAWYLHTIDRRIIRRSQEALLAAFRKRQARGLLNRIVAMWFDLAVHKRVEVRTRGQLIKALQEQEEANMMIEESMREYSLVLQEAEASLQREDIKQKNMQIATQELETQLVAARMAMHSSQQEAIKLRSTLRNYELRFPNAFRVPGETAAKLGDTPLIVNSEDHTLLKRLRWAVDSHLYEAAYVPPRHAESAADRELLRLQRFLAYILKGTMPDGSKMADHEVDEKVLRELIDNGVVKVPEGLEPKELGTRIATHADGGEALALAAERPGLEDASKPGYWQSSAAAFAPDGADGGEPTLLRINERSLKWSDIAQTASQVAPLPVGMSLVGDPSERTNTRSGVERRIQEAKEWKHTWAPRRAFDTRDEVKERVNLYNMVEREAEAAGTSAAATALESMGVVRAPPGSRRGSTRIGSGGSRASISSPEIAKRHADEAAAAVANLGDVAVPDLSDGDDDD